MSVKILVTGGVGYIGSVLVRHLLDNSYHVTVLDNLMYHQNQTGLLQYCYRDSFNFVAGDVRNKTLMQELLKQHDIIIPLAAIVGVPICDRDPWLAESINYESIRLLNELRSLDQPIIFPSTNSSYGAQEGLLPCTEKTFLNPISLYGRTKVKAEELLLGSKNTISLRFATVFGVSQRMRLDLLVNDFTYRAVRDQFIPLYEAHFRRSYVHIEDVARSFCHCIEHFDQMSGEAYNVGLHQANLTKYELAEKIKEHVPGLEIHCSETGVDPDKRNYVTSTDKIRAKGFETIHSLDEGIVQLLKAYQMIQFTGFGNARH